jgi:hypothetical protein
MWVLSSSDEGLCGWSKRNDRAAAHPDVGPSRHVVVGMTRSPGKADSIRAAGAEPVVADALDEDAVLAATRPSNLTPPTMKLDFR